MNRIVIILFKTVRSLLLLAVVLSLGAPIILFFGSFIWMAITESKLEKPKIYQPVGRALAMYCQSDSVITYCLDGAWLASELKPFAKHNPCVGIRADRGEVSFGGGFHHYGIRVVLDREASTGDSNVWVVNHVSEDQKDTKLETFTLPKAFKLTTQEVVSRVHAGTQTLVAGSPTDLASRIDSLGKKLKSNEVQQARRDCEGLLAVFPENWWVLTTNALLMIDKISPRELERLMGGQTYSAEAYFRWLDMAYIYRQTSHPREAGDALKKAAAEQVDFFWHQGGTAESRGYSAAMWAYRDGEYEAAENVCEHLLSSDYVEESAKRGLQALKDACDQAKNGEAPKVEWDRNIPEFDPYAEFDIAKLLGHPLEHPADRK